MAHNITRHQHSVISRAIMPLSERTDVRYRLSPLFGYSPKILIPGPMSIFAISFTDGTAKDYGKYQFSITENNNPDYENNSPFNGLALHIPSGSNKLCYLPYDSDFVVSHPVYLEAWVYVNDLNMSGCQEILSSWENGNISLHLDSGYLTGMITINGTDVSLSSQNLFKEKMWIYTAFAYDGKRMVLYENFDEYVVGQRGSIDKIQNPMVIGGRWATGSIDTDYSLNGYIAYVGMGRRSKNYREVERYLIGL